MLFDSITIFHFSLPGIVLSRKKPRSPPTNIFVVNNMRNTWSTSLTPELHAHQGDERDTVKMLSDIYASLVIQCKLFKVMPYPVRYLFVINPDSSL